MAYESDRTTISLNSKLILEKAFTPHGNGYDPDEVDAFLDQIIHDYMAFELYYKESKQYTVSLENSLREAREKISNLEVLNASLNAKIGGVKESDKVSSENIAMLNRMRKLETELYKRGVDPNSI